MSTLFDADSPSNLTEYSVSELSGSIKRTVETAFDQVRLRGEVSGYRGPHSSGHAYFSLKDDKARIDAVIWKMSFARLKVKPEEGMEVIATGKVTTFPGSSKYQIVIETLEPAGAGALMALIEERKRRLGAEGLFDAARKRPLPFLPRVIGVVTSPTGAVIRDILHRIADRFPVHVLVWPVKVQGEGCGDEVAAAIRGFNALGPDSAFPRPDVLIVARGGGSLEDLWGFNDEAVVRAAAESRIPLISAVGHETDWTLIDLAADRRAPTPTGAAEMAVPVKADLEAQMATLGARLSSATLRQLDSRRQSLRALSRALPVLDQLLALPRRRLDEAASTLGRTLEILAVNKRRLFERSAARLRPDVLSARLAERQRHLGELSARSERLTERRLEVARRPLLRAETVLAAQPQRLATIIIRDRERLARLTRDASRAVAQDLSVKRQSLAAAWRMLESLSYTKVLERGFAVVRGPDGQPLSRARAVATGMALSLEFADGRVAATAGAGALPDTGSAETGPAAVPAASASRKRVSKAGNPDGGQGNLF